MSPKKKSKKPAVNLDKISKEEARIIIAKDVLSQLKKEKYKAEPQVYCQFDITEAAEKKVAEDSDDFHYRFELFRPSDVGGDMQKIIQQRVESCDVCAKGALFVSMVRKFDEVSVKEKGNQLFEPFINSKLQRFFSPSQLAMIEYAFEKGYGVGHCQGVASRENLIAAQYFGEGFSDPTQRMVAIMKNIIKNKGTFIPPARKALQEA